MTIFIGNKKSYATSSHWSDSVDRFSFCALYIGWLLLFISSDKNRHFLNAIFLRLGIPCIVD
jgi:hypothetical protein